MLLEILCTQLEEKAQVIMGLLASAADLPEAAFPDGFVDNRLRAGSAS